MDPLGGGEPGFPTFCKWHTLGNELNHPKQKIYRHSTTKAHAAHWSTTEGLQTAVLNPLASQSVVPLSSTVLPTSPMVKSTSQILKWAANGGRMEGMEASGLLTLFFGTRIVFDMHLRYTVRQTFPLIFSPTVPGLTRGHLLVLSLSQLLITIATKEVILNKTHALAQSEVLFWGGGIRKISGEMTTVTAQPNPQQLDEATVRGKVDGSTKQSHYMGEWKQWGS